MILRNHNLRNLNSFGLDYNANRFIYVRTQGEAVQLAADKKLFRKPYFILGGGSNLLFTGNYAGTIIHPVIEGIRIIAETTEFVIVSAGAGLKWDTLAEWAVLNSFGGLENLSFIPGSVGASPVQNIGAYGAEVKDVIHRVLAVELETGLCCEFDPFECRFGYRNSIFKDEKKGRYLITCVLFKLLKRPTLNLEYGPLREEVVKIGPPSLKSIRQAVINIRKSKLPDPTETGNAGSFFKNPVVDISIAEKIKGKYKDIPVYDVDQERKKISAGWMIEKCGWKGRSIGNAGVYEKQALVIVNNGKASGTEILNLSEQIRNSVYEKFGVMLEREVEVVG